MANKNYRKNNRHKNGNSKDQRNNFQDNAERREYNKGFKAGRRGSAVPVDTGASKDNDPMWYGLNPQLLKDAGSFPFSRVAGYPIPWQKGKLNSGSGYLSEDSKTRTPGILVLRTGHALGSNRDSGDPSSPINVAIQSLYAYTRKANSGAANYDPNAMAAYVLSLSDAYAFYSWLVRAYGVINNYSATNRYYPEALVRAMGLNFTALKSSLADFRMLINQIAYQLQSRKLPKSIMYTTRHIWMYENIYTDSNSDTGKQQIYLFNPIGFLMLNEKANPMTLELTSPGGVPSGFSNVKGAIVPIGQPASSGYALSDLTNYANRILSPIMASQDFGIISGDLSKAFGDGEMMNVLGIAETYRVTPTYSAEVLSQIENSKSISVQINSQPYWIRNYYQLSTEIGTSMLLQHLHLYLPGPTKDQG